MLFLPTQRSGHRTELNFFVSGTSYQAGRWASELASLVSRVARVGHAGAMRVGLTRLNQSRPVGSHGPGRCGYKEMDGGENEYIQ